MFSFCNRNATRLTGQAIACVVACLWAVNAFAIDLNDEPKLRKIADELIAEYGFTEPYLQAVFSAATVREEVLQAMQNPAEYKFTWGKYRNLFLQPERIAQGVEFWQTYAEELQRAEQEYGVPASVIVAIIGVESKFGRYKGSHKVLDSLVTLVTGYPRRSEFFAGELKHFLLLARDNQMDPATVLGSYAGAVGFPQFIASSYRNYAVDFSGDGVVDLIGQPVDAIGSVANYFVKNGWLSGQPVSSAPLTSLPPDLMTRANRKRKVQFSAAELRQLGADLDSDIPADEKLNVLQLDASEVYSEPARKGEYVVRAGDTACEVAERLEVRCADLFALNNLNAKGEIYRGQHLQVPSEKYKPSEQGSKQQSWVVQGKATPREPNHIASIDHTRPVYFFTHENFYVITRYNHSVLYAMAVHDLSMATAAAHAAAAQRQSAIALAEDNEASTE